jgi:hypothetical protein
VIGTQTVTVQSAQAGTPDRKGIPATNYVAYTWQGCSLQPMEVREEVTNIDFLINKFRLIGPPTSVGLAVKTTDHIVDANNVTYRVIGTKIPPSRKGIPHHVEVLLENPSGLNAA